eukprot:TRINITY_DN882_c0_g1_i1.p1 TRINITY_DN882_c0_g1~~TRINITY_DN882_c0_g1_i1.p1  ORF type:complete len:2377 (-),score=590.06 TRINITY_DN882_c0_g1_i1:39-6899(-)
MGGIMAIDHLIDVDTEENANKITRFANYLRIVLPNNDPATMVMASKALGHLASAGGTLTADFVEFEVKRALEWLQGDRYEPRRHAAVLVLKELAENAPTLFYVHVSTFFDLMWVALRDAKLVIREGAVDALKACLHLIAERESAQRLSWYRKIFEEAQRGFEKNSSDSVHGSLMAIGELLRNTGEFMLQHYKATCEAVLRYRDHREKVIRKTVILLMPMLAAFCREDFVLNYQRACMEHLLATLKKNDNERGPAFLAVGEMCVAIGDYCSPYLSNIMVQVKEGLSTKKKGMFCIEALTTVSMLARAVGVQLKPHVAELLEQLFAVPLSQPLVDALTDLGMTAIPEILPTVQERLLNRLSLILSGNPYRAPGMPPSTPTASPLGGGSSIREAPIDLPDPELTILALRTLGTFDFSGNQLSEFAREVVLNYTDDDNTQIRKEACLTCATLLTRPNEAAQTKGHGAIVVSEVLEKLLTVGIADPDPSIRLAVLASLDSRFDLHLAQAENLRSLFIALNDEVFEIRDLAISMIGRLTIRNPAYVMPSLRKTLIQLLTELEYSGDSRNKEESAQLLGQLIRSSQRLIKPYVEPILKALLPKLKDGSQGVATCVLAALGELANVAGEDIATHCDGLIPQIIDTLQDQSSAGKREVALRTLGQLVSSTGYAIEPYIKYPNLLNIILGMLKTEQSPPIRRELVKVLGILGALDPYKHKMIQQYQQQKQQQQSKDGSDVLPGMGPSSEDYYPTVAIAALMRILRDASHTAHHTMVIQAVMFIFKSLGMKCVPFLPQIMPPFLQVMRMCEPNFRDFLFQQLGMLVSIVKQHIRDYLDPIIELIKENWNTSLLAQIIILVEEISSALNDEFKVYLPDLIPSMLGVLHTDKSERRNPTQKVLHALETFGTNLDDYLHLVIPAVVKLFEQVDAPVTVRLNAIQTLGRLCRKLNFSDYASRIIHPLARVLDVPYQELRREAMETLCALVYQLGLDYAVFAPMVTKVLAKQRIQHPRYEQLVSRLLKNQPLPPDPTHDDSDRTAEARAAEDAVAADAGGVKKLHVNQQNLKKAWEASQRSTKDDWMEWIRRFSVELLRESPSPALRSCSALAQVYYPLARELFNAGFVSCWTELYDPFQDLLVRSLETALLSPNIPPEILQTLLNLAEFMEHDDKPLPIDIRTLGSLAEKCHAYAKALHYKEIEFHAAGSMSQTIEALISINNQLQQPEAAVGILLYAQQNHSVELKESWYEKLHRWEDALEAYERKQLEDQASLEVTLGMMRCLNALGEWERLGALSSDTWRTAGENTRRLIAPLAAAAAWNLGNWSGMEMFVGGMPEGTVESSFFRAILMLHKHEYNAAQKFIDKARLHIDTELTALVGESYDRAYNQVVRVQQLAELEEMITYRQSKDDSERRSTIRSLWTKRLKGCQRNVEVWQQVLAVRAMVVPAREDVYLHLKYAALCRKSGRLSMSHKVLMNLLGTDSSTPHPTETLPCTPVGFHYIKHIFATPGGKPEAFERLKAFVSRLNAMEPATSSLSVAEIHSLQARCRLKLGHWQRSLDEALDETSIPEILGYFRSATEHDGQWYKAWHSYALMNFEVASFYAKNTGKPDQISAHVVAAIAGFFRSVALGSGGSSGLQDTLRLLTLWFQHGATKDVEQALKEGFSSVSIDTWLEVIPQLIARIHSPVVPVRRLIHELLTSVGKEHPQALVFPLTVASKSQSDNRRTAALNIIEKMKQHSATLVEQASLVSEELIRVAILWHEMWHEGLEEASRLYFGDHNVEAMFATLKPLHDMLDKGPSTLRETSFQQAFGRDLKEAQEWCEKYQRSKKVPDLNQAWDLYYHVFRRINKQLPQLTTLELQYVSPKLQECKDLQLCVPGTYVAGGDLVRIGSFSTTLLVITSKQRPRKITIHGTDGVDYFYLLKGHEDLRQDERVMQLFGLANTLLASERETARRHLSITRYAVVPLSPNSGIIGWVPHCDTLHACIRDYREARKILLNIEHRLMLQMAPDYDNLTLMQKVEVFEYALENTTGQDLYKVLWLKSRNSEVWLDRRTNYTRSLAVMSMVGYILGLGDRHPSNLMMDRHTGKILHIDFGDCFEVAMHRDKFPERIPFRLTRMLINAMEVSGIEGNFRSTCESVMSVLRENKESLMAVLEAFVHDPLINWRLLTTTASPRQDGKAVPKERVSGAVGDVEPGEAPAGEAAVIGAASPLLSPQINRAGGNREREMFSSLAETGAADNVLNEKALTVVERVQNKLTGKDFAAETLDVQQQVQRLVMQATSHENLCQCYIGWCPFW